MLNFHIFICWFILAVGSAKRQTTTRLPPTFSLNVSKQEFDLSKLKGIRLENSGYSEGVLKEGGLLSDALLKSPLSGSGEQLARTLSKVDLLALKVDHSLMAGLERWLAKYNIEMPASLVDQIRHMEMCPDDAKDGLRHYCTKMPDGQYYDPWNPWCGYVDCLDGLATRMVCKPGTWMGYVSDETQSLLTKDRMCRRLLKEPILSSVCQELTDYQLCRRVGALSSIERTASPLIPPPVA